MRENAFARVDFVKRVVSHSSRHELCRIIRHLESAIAMQRLHVVPRGCIARIEAFSYRAGNRLAGSIWIADAHRDDGKRFVAVASANRSTACSGLQGGATRLGCTLFRFTGRFSLASADREHHAPVGRRNKSL